MSPLLATPASLRTCSAADAAREARNDNGELRGFSWLGNVHLIAGGQRAHPILDSRISRQRNGRNQAAPCLRLSTSHLADQLIAVLVRHFNVAHYHIRL